MTSERTSSSNLHDYQPETHIGRPMHLVVKLESGLKVFNAKDVFDIKKFPPKCHVLCNFQWLLAIKMISGVNS